MIFPVPVLTQLNSSLVLPPFQLPSRKSVVFGKQFIVKNHIRFQSGLSAVPSIENAWISNFFRLHKICIHKEQLIRSPAGRVNSRLDKALLARRKNYSSRTVRGVRGYTAVYDVCYAIYVNRILYNNVHVIKGTLMHISKSPYMFVFLEKQYLENFAFLILRILELLAPEVCKFIKK